MKSHPKEFINIKDRLDDISKTKDFIPLINEIFEEVRGKNDIEISFPKGTYHFYPTHCVKQEYFMSNTSDNNPKNCGIFLKDQKNIIINGNHSDFIFHDRMSTFTLDNCDHITIQNANLDWEIPLGAEARIVKVKRLYVDIELDPVKYPHKIKRGKIIFMNEYSESKWQGVMEFNIHQRVIPLKTGDRSLGFNWRSYIARRKKNNIIRLYYLVDNPPEVGNYIVMRHHERDHAGIFIFHSKNIMLENINMYSNAGLGVLTQKSENLQCNNVNVIPNREKREFLSGHDDGFQISNCKGEVIIENCEFEGLMDDPINIHGTSVKIQEILSERSLIASFEHHQSIGMIFAQKGDEIGFIDHKTMHTVQKVWADDVEKIDQKQFIIKFSDSIPKTIKKGDALENLSWTPNVLIRKCKFLSCRARGLLISTSGKVIVEENYFKSSGTAILIAGDANNWYESGAVNDVLIQRNDFSEFCLANMYQFCEGIISICPEIPKPSMTEIFHKNIKIYDNLFHPFDYPVLYAFSTETLSFVNNKIMRSSIYHPYHKRKAMISLEYCKNIIIEGNQIQKEILGQNVCLKNTEKDSVSIENQNNIILE